MSRKRKKRLKNSVKRILIFILLLGLIGMGGYIYIKEYKPTSDSLPIVPEPNPSDEPEIEKIPDTFLNKVTNSTDYTIKEGWQNIIVKYLDLYYKSLYTLDEEDVTYLFTDSNSNEAYLTQKALELIVKHHKLQDSDMSLTSATYDIDYQNISINNNIVTIKILKDDNIKFKFLNGIESKSYDMSVTFVIRKTDDNYSIDSIRVIQDYYVMFTNEVNTNSSNAKITIDKLFNEYLDSITKEVDKNKELQKNSSYTSIKEYDHEFDRDKATYYAMEYVDKRNSKFTSYDSSGGNCMNFASQVINAGGIPMDYIGNYQWKHYSSVLNNSNTATGRTASWVSTNSFYEYAKNNTGFGLVSDVDVNIFSAEPGDIIQVGYYGYSHTTVAVKQIKDSEGNVIDVLINCNTLSLENYPLLGYVYPNKRLIKILGYND